MKRYKIYTKGKFQVIKEVSTNFIIYATTQKSKAFDLANKLNNGYGFAGETPPFFLNKKDQQYI